MSLESGVWSLESGVWSLESGGLESGVWSLELEREYLRRVDYCSNNAETDEEVENCAR